MWDSCIQKLLKETSVLITTHQLNYIKEADYIYNLESGKIIEEGKPENLLNEETDIGRQYSRFTSTDSNEKDKTTSKVTKSEPKISDKIQETESKYENDEKATLFEKDDVSDARKSWKFSIAAKITLFLQIFTIISLFIKISTIF